MKIGKTLWFVLLATQAILLSGCATSALWEEGRFSRYHEPATPPNIQVFYSRQSDDLLVRYDEVREGNESVKRRAYWLGRNGEPVRNPHKPRFVRMEAVHGLTPIPVLDTATNLPPLETGLYAVVSTNAQDFTLHSREKTLGSYELPVYPDASGRVKQVLLTPFAVVADLTIVGGVLVVVSLPSSWESLNRLTE